LKVDISGTGTGRTPTFIDFGPAIGRSLRQQRTSRAGPGRQWRSARLGKGKIEYHLKENGDPNGSRTPSNISQIRAISAETCGNQRVKCNLEECPFCTIRANKRTSSVRFCPKIISQSPSLARVWSCCTGAAFLWESGRRLASFVCERCSFSDARRVAASCALRLAEQVSTMSRSGRWWWRRAEPISFD
jgi:hypothetical protein